MAVKTITVAITGASGGVYAQRLLWHLERSDEVGRVHLVVSAPGRRVLAEELDVAGSGDALVESLVGGPSEKIDLVPSSDIGAKIASGSYPVDGMAIVPCSMSTIGALASGAVTNLVHRAADVMLKERRTLIIVPRETPMSLPQLRNMTLCAEAGAMLMPAMPAFYQMPKTLDDLADFMAGKILAALGFAHDLYPSWEG